MDQLPDLRSDADVDALMARIRARLVTPAAPGHAPAGPPELSGNALRDFLAVQEEYASAMLQTMQLLTETLEELESERHVGPGPRTRNRRSAPPRINGRRSSKR